MRPVYPFSSVKSLLVTGAFLALLPRGYAAEEIKIKHLLVASEQEAAEIRAEIVASGGDRKSFTVACRKYSKDSTTKKLGGTLDWVSQRSGFDPTFKKAAFELEKGQISQPVLSQYGWHLIYLMDRRDRSKRAAVPATTPSTQPRIPPNPITSPPVAPDQGQNQLVPPVESSTPAGGTPEGTPQITVTPVVTATPAVKAERSSRLNKVTVTLESGKSRGTGTQRALFLPNQALEVNVYIKNSGKEEFTVFAPEVAALGFRLTEVGERIALTGDFSSLSEPENLLVTLKPYQIVGLEVSLNDYYAVKQGRYRVSWDTNTFFTQLESRFPQVTSLANYVTVKAALTRPGALSVDRIVRAAYPYRSVARGGLNMSVFDRLQSTGKYFAELKLQGEAQPIVIELNAAQQYSGVRHFADLAMAGFYDNLNFFDVVEGDYLLGGSPTSTGTGAPDMRLPQVRNKSSLEHERGTVSFVSRRIRKGPVSGGEIGSIFFVLLKDHPEWDKEHVPFGKVISGMEILEKVTTRKRFESITIVTEAGRTEVAAQTADSSAAQTTTGNPQALIKTSKGDLEVELFDRDARNTVANFITLTEDGFFNKNESGDGKQSFFNLTENEAGERLSIQAGSPSNNEEGGAGYLIRSEANRNKHTRGALSMMQKWLPDEGRFVPDSAGSQFFICLSDIPYFDTMRLTVFGKVTKGLEVLGKLEDGDTIESVEITKKKSRAYRVRKVR